MRNSPETVNLGEVEPRERLLQHDYGGDDRWTPWRVLVVTQLCQRTTGAQVRQAAEGLFDRWPTPDAMASSNPELEEQLKPAGFAKSRARRLREMSARYAFWAEENPELERPPSLIVRGWPGVGAYTEQAYRLVVEGDTSFIPDDKELVRFWAYKTLS